MSERALWVSHDATANGPERVIQADAGIPAMNQYRLRPLEPSDAGLVLRWRNSDRIRSVMYSDDLIKPEEHEAWFKGLLERTDVSYRMLEVEGRPAGLVYFTKIDRHVGLSVWGFYLGEESLPKGTGLRLGFLGLEHAFQELGLKKIQGESFVFNSAALALHRKLGFVQESVLRSHTKKCGQVKDVALFGLKKEDWERHRETLRLGFFGEL